MSAWVLLTALVCGCIGGGVSSWLTVRYLYPILARRWPERYGPWTPWTPLPDPAPLLAERDRLIAEGVDPDTLVALTALCPECVQGKPQNCAGQALLGDDLVPCATTLPEDPTP